MIPKKIHYCWFGDKKIPREVKKCINSWKKYCKDYEIILWNEKNFDIKANSFIKEAYKFKAWAFVSDYARLKILYENGGIYLDTDVEIIKSIDELLDNKAYIGMQQQGGYIATGLGFGAEKGNSVIKLMLDDYEKIHFSKEKMNELACPIINSKTLINIGFNKEIDSSIQILDNIKIYPPKYFDPIAPGNTRNLLCSDTYSIHHYNASWTNYRGRLKRKLINLVGQEKINKLKKKLRGTQ